MSRRNGKIYRGASQCDSRKWHEWHEWHEVLLVLLDSIRKCLSSTKERLVDDRLNKGLSEHLPDAIVLVVLIENCSPVRAL